MPDSRTSLSSLPKLRTANSLSQVGVRSIALLPTARNGEALGEISPPTRCPVASPAAVESSPISAATGMDNPDGVSGTAGGAGNRREVMPRRSPSCPDGFNEKSDRDGPYALSAARKRRS